MRMREREPNGRKLGQGWGNGGDLRARPSDKAMRIVKELQHGHARIAVLTDTRLAGEEAQAMQAHLYKWHGLGCMRRAARAGRATSTQRRCGTS